MAKPAITKRTVKGAALTYTELDNNFENLRNATVTLTAGTGGTQVTADLNGNITVVAGTNVTLTGDNTAKTITINATGGGSLDTNSIVIGDNTNNQVQILANTGSGTSKSIIISSYNSGNIELAGSVSLRPDIFTNKVNIGGPLQLRSDHTTTNRNNDFSPQNGMIFYNSSTHKFQGYANGTWVDLH